MHLKHWTEFAVVEIKACRQPLLIMLDHEDGNSPMILLAFGHKLNIYKCDEIKKCKWSHYLCSSVNTLYQFCIEKRRL